MTPTRNNPVSPTVQDPRMHLDYLALYVRDPESSVACYEAALGLQFQREQHGGPVHFSTQLGGTILELYPAAGGRPTSRVRLGITVPDPYSVGPAPCTITRPRRRRHRGHRSRRVSLIHRRGGTSCAWRSSSSARTPGGSSRTGSTAARA